MQSSEAFQLNFFNNKMKISFCRDAKNRFAKACYNTESINYFINSTQKYLPRIIIKHIIAVCVFVKH